MELILKNVKAPLFPNKKYRFINEKLWDAVYQKLKPSDYAFIQFGHNDEKEKDSLRYTNPNTAYRYNLIRFA